MRHFGVPLPKRMMGLPVDKRGYPVPKFVEWIDGDPDFRVMSTKHFQACVRRGVCWLCGYPLGQFKVFVIGPMCCLNRISSEPPSHYECARFAATACPFLTRPKAKRRAANLPAETVEPAGVMLKHNPGLTALWVARDYKLMKVDSGYLFRLGPPARVEFFAEGHRANRGEVDAAIDKGFPALAEMAAREGPKAWNELTQSRAWFERRVDEWIGMQ